MNAEILHALLENVANLLAMAFVLDLATKRYQFEGRRAGQVLLGLMLGGFGIGVILASFRFESGIVFDTRSVLLAISGLFLGPIPTGIAMGITAAHRLFEGGIAASTGVAVILASGGIGIAWRQCRRGLLSDISWRELYALGMGVHVVMLALMLTLPWQTARRVLMEISLPVLLVYPLATVAIGLLLAGRIRTERATVALAESEERYRSLFANNHAVMLITDPRTGAIVDANPAACRFYGYTHAQIVQLDLSQINTLPPEELEAEMARAHATKRYHFLFAHRQASGAVRDVEVCSGPITVDGRTLLHSIIHDITDRRQAEMASRESAALVRMAGRMGRLGGWRVKLAEGRVLWSDEVASIHEKPPGYSPSLEEAIAFCAPEWREKIQAHFDACVREGRPYDAELEIITAHGRRVAVHTVASAVRDAGGRIIGVEGALQDITARRQAEENTRRLLAELTETQRVLLSMIEDQKKVEVEREKVLARTELSRRTLLSVVEDQRRSEARLAESEERFRRAVLESPFPIMLHAENGSILQVSNSWCEVTGYTREELPTIAAWTERAFGERKDLVQAEIDRLFGLAHRVAEGDSPVRTKTGGIRIWEFSSAPLGALPDGRRLVISMAMDVTERRAAEKQVQELNVLLEKRVLDRTAQLEAANQELEAFAYSVSHDLRAPLRAMDGFSHALLEECADQLDERGRNYLTRVRGAAARMAALIEDLLRLSRVTRAELRREKMDLSAIARTTIGELRQAEPDRVVAVDIAPDLAGEGDTQLLHIVLTNLLGNAWKFTGREPNARIEFGVRPMDGTLAYFVRDNGAGFDMAYAQKLFGVFQRLHAATEFPGTGIGLASVQRIIHRHGGRVWAEGAVGQGATFFFTLEGSPTKGSGAAESRESLIAVPRTRSPAVLNPVPQQARESTQSLKSKRP